MGNLIPLDGAKKQECEEIAKEFIATFNAQYVLAYGVEFTKMKMKQVDKEAYGEPETDKELMYREFVKCTEPHKMGALTKKGAIVKNWKHRYFVVNPDFSVAYYETEEAFHKNLKPKGVIHLAGYEVADSADNAKIEQLKALAKKLGIDAESLPLPEKFPAHTLALFHERRRDYFITAADEDEKKEWAEMFRTCCRKTKGFTNDDPVAQEAFKAAYRRACYESNWYRRINPTGGTEEQVLSETLVEIINSRVLSSVYSGLTGNFTIRKKVRGQVMKVLDSMVLAIVVPAYKTLVETTEKMKAPLEKTFNEKKDDIVDAQKKITEQLADKMETIVHIAFEEANADMKKLYEDLKELTVRSSTEMRNECVVRLMERLVKDTKGDKDVAGVIKKHYRAFDRVAQGLTTWDHWYKVYNIEQESIAIMNKYKETFEMGGSYNYLYQSHDMLKEVADAAFYTFEQTFDKEIKDSDILKDSNKASEKMDKVKDEVVEKYDHDSKATPQDVSFELTTTYILEYVSKKIDPLTKDIRKNAQSVIPEPLKQLVSIQERYELYLEQCVRELIRRAVGIPKPQKKVKTKECDKSEKQNGEVETSKKENGLEKKDEAESVNENESEGDKNVEENGQEVEPEEKEVQENGNTTEASSEEVKENGEGNTEEKQEETKEETLEENGNTEENEQCDEKSQEQVEDTNDDTVM